MTTATPLTVSVPTAQLRDDLGELPDGVEVVIWDMKDAAPRERFDMVVPPYMSMDGVVEALSSVEVGLVQSQSIGYDNVEGRLPEGLVFANASSVHETATAELAVALALAAQRRLPEFVRAQDRGEWIGGGAPGLADRRVTLLGFGGVGRAIAARLKPFELELRAVASHGRLQDEVEVFPLGELAEVLADTDILIASLPGGDATRHIIDDAALSALPDGALVVNVGRGPLVDTDALVDHVRRGRIRAALDVTDPEPLPAGHPLWSLEGALVVPHVGGATDAMRPRIARLVRRQIDRLRAGEEPLNVVLGG
ncbi:MULTISPECIES: NAD(P)-dependent oxidoreductase [Microbacterium]|uniref:NAD(P)-dependent oxidoreductase n=1 Tax=Microbacterium TaxID=33882 RepID=UPI0023DAC98E|nr:MULTISPECIES: NAD(P)-dependent oxidoreductase [Microbacterium]MDF2047842.1 NAD(P)-dependent oxidoreductase [Microbacterium sp. Kw_RZR3]MDQ1074655.1 phosphoglycerate dehydrogenase-like enzyme [Microbacterium sp. SORGH_AS_0969]MDQ1114879.1 phosphoglycerate dehydrogenase-like enzyme [Microbacterium testaceum]